jgi:hypothetical protein
VTVIDVVNLSFGQMGCFDYIHTHLNSYTVYKKTNINGINFVDKRPHAWHTTCYIEALRVCNMQIINWYLSASLYKSLYACLFSIHCFYVYCGYEKGLYQK